MILAAGTAAPCAAAASAPKWRWVSANEYYFILPTAQRLRVPDRGGSVTVHPWGVGFRAVGGEGVSRTGALQLQSVKVDSAGVGRDTFYLLDLLLGLEYITPQREGRPLRFKAGASADLGLSDNDLYFTPVLSAGLLYGTDAAAETQKGFTFDVYYRLTDIDLDGAVNGYSATLRPALGFRVGYIFEGFWTVKQ